MTGNGQVHHHQLNQFFIDCSRTISPARLLRLSLQFQMQLLDGVFGIQWISCTPHRHIHAAFRGMRHDTGRRVAGQLLRQNTSPSGFIPRQQLDAVVHQSYLQELINRSAWETITGIFIQPVPSRPGCRGYLVIGLQDQPSAEAARTAGEVMDFTAACQERLHQIQRLKDENRRLNSVSRKLAETDRSKSSFLSSLTHELKTPLNAIIGFTELILSCYADKLPDSAVEYLSYIKEAGLRQLNLVKDLLSITRFDVGAERPRPTHVALHKLIAQLVDKAQERYPQKNVAIAYQFAPDTENLFLDGRMLRQLLANLVDNAFKFSRENGHVEIDSRLDGSGETDPVLLVAIRDDGIGIAAEHASRLFQPFSQIDQSLARRYEGTGLGLYICKRLTEIMGGSISFSSTPGQGSTFVVRLPISDRV